MFLDMWKKFMNNGAMDPAWTTFTPLYALISEQRKRDLNKKTVNSTNTQEADPHGKSQHEPGAKLDAGKPCVYRGAVGYFPRAIEAVAEVSTAGARKYAWKGWETVPEGVERYSDAMVRHLIAEGRGETLDADTGLLHAAQTAWNALARLELMLRKKEGVRE